MVVRFGLLVTLVAREGQSEALAATELGVCPALPVATGKKSAGCGADAVRDAAATFAAGPPMHFIQRS
jgi:hypothetical protein